MPVPASPSDEVERLRRVYRDYDDDPETARRWSDGNPGNRAIADQRRARSRSLLREQGRWPVAGTRTLELGCGSGGALADLFGDVVDSAPIVGVDLSDERLRVAAARVPAVALVRAEGSLMPFPSARFDLVVAFTVFSSVRDGRLAQRMAAEVDRVLRPGGAVVWYDMRHPNLRNPHTRAMPKRAVRALFPGFVAQFEPITLLPPLARRLGRATGRVYGALALLRPLNSHYLGLLRKPA